MEKAKQNNQDYDFVIVSSSANEQDNIQMLEELRTNYLVEKLKIIYISHYPYRGEASKVQQSGVNAYLPLPLDSELLVDAIFLAMENSTQDNSLLITRYVIQQDSEGRHVDGN